MDKSPTISQYMLEYARMAKIPFAPVSKCDNGVAIDLGECFLLFTRSKHQLVPKTIKLGSKVPVIREIALFYEDGDFYCLYVKSGYSITKSGKFASDARSLMKRRFPCLNPLPLMPELPGIIYSAPQDPAEAASKPELVDRTSMTDDLIVIAAGPNAEVSHYSNGSMPRPASQVNRFRTRITIWMAEFKGKEPKMRGLSSSQLVNALIDLVSITSDFSDQEFVRSFPCMSTRRGREAQAVLQSALFGPILASREVTRILIWLLYWGNLDINEILELLGYLVATGSSLSKKIISKLLVAKDEADKLTLDNDEVLRLIKLVFTRLTTRYPFK